MKKSKVRASAKNAPPTDQQFILQRAQEFVPHIEAAYRRTRGKQKKPTKRLVSLRLDPDLIEYFRSRGPGWQGRINATLRKAVGM